MLIRICNCAKYNIVIICQQDCKSATTMYNVYMYISLAAPGFWFGGG
ncbi:MAG: hypothetical protein FD143_3752, partial [Ignavibacteria bacterium]